MNGKTNKAAFLLTAGFGTRFKPQTDFLPKPAMPFFNLPQALFPVTALQTNGVDSFFYNSHHLPKELEESLSWYLPNKPFYEPEILDSAGGLQNAKAQLAKHENFWVANGDSLIFLKDSEVLNEAWDFHLKHNATATLVGIQKNSRSLRGLSFDKNQLLTGRSFNNDALHFVGLYIFNTEIFNSLPLEKSHILTDVLLNDFSGKALVFNAKNRIRWYETGNEPDFIQAHKDEALNLLNKKEDSSLFKVLKNWNKSNNIDLKLEHFQEHRVWGQNFKPKNSVGDFLCLPESSTGDFSNLKNCVLGKNLRFDSSKSFADSVLIHPSQWT